MKFLIYSISADGAGLAFKLASEGHDVCIFIKDRFCAPILEGMIEHVSSLKGGLATNPDLIIFDKSGEGKIADDLRSQGYAVVGSSAFADKLEMDRTYGMETAKSLGILMPDYTEFSAGNIDDAIKFVQESDARFVLKPHDNLSLDMTYVAKDAEDMVQMLTWAKENNILKGDFLLQDFVKGIEISTEIWLSHGKIIPGLCNGTIEQKKFMTGDKGPATGCESSIVWPYSDESAKIVEATVGRMKDFLEKEQYHGPIDVNAIVSEETGDAFFLEFTPRLGYSAFYTFAELLPNRDLGEFFQKLEAGDDQELDGGVSACLTVSIPPYPLDSDEKVNQPPFKLTEGKKILNPPETGFWPMDIRMVEDEFVTAGIHGLVGYFSVWGSDVANANEALYKLVESCTIPNVQYRVDADARALKDVPLLAEFGYEVPELGEK